MNKKITFDRFIRGLIAIAGCIVAYLLINRLSGALLPFLIAWLFCYLIYPIVKFFQYKLKFKSRLLSIITVLLLITAIIVGISFFLFLNAFFVANDTTCNTGALHIENIYHQLSYLKWR